MRDSVRPFDVVTGDSSGIGLELARQFAGNGHDLLIAAQEGGHLRDATSTLSANGAQVHRGMSEPGSGR